jgi:hypothetical protein
MLALQHEDGVVGLDAKEHLDQELGHVDSAEANACEQEVPLDS